MLEKLHKSLKGYVKIKAEGKSPERFMNLCNAHKILLWDVEVCGMIYEMKVSAADYKRLRPFVKKTGTKLTILNKYGLPFFIHRFRKRRMFFSGLCICTAFVYLMSLFLWNIHFEGNITQSTEQLIDYLETMGVKHGTQKSKIVCEDIERNLRKEYPNMLWVSAEIRGTRMIIQIKENEDKDILSKIEEKDETPVSIAAQEDGVIESMIVRAGTPVVSIGDEVKKGQILVEGYYAIKNDGGEILKYEETAADADISLISVKNYSDSFSLFYQEKHYTGKKRLGAVLHLFQREIPVKPGIFYEKYDESRRFTQIHITENFYLPLSVEWIWYQEYQEVEKYYTKKEMIKIAEERFLQKFENILQKGVQIIEKDVKINTNDKLCIVGGSVKFRVPVTEKVPVIIPETAQERSVEGEQSI